MIRDVRLCLLLQFLFLPSPLPTFVVHRRSSCKSTLTPPASFPHGGKVTVNFPGLMSELLLMSFFVFLPSQSHCFDCSDFFFDSFVRAMCPHPPPLRIYSRNPYVRSLFFLTFPASFSFRPCPHRRNLCDRHILSFSIVCNGRRPSRGQTQLTVLPLTPSRWWFPPFLAFFPFYACDAPTCFVLAYSSVLSTLLFLSF